MTDPQLRGHGRWCAVSVKKVVKKGCTATPVDRAIVSNREEEILALSRRNQFPAGELRFAFCFGGRLTGQDGNCSDQEIESRQRAANPNCVLPYSH